MDITDIESRSYSDLKDMATELGLPIRRSKALLAQDIMECFKEYEAYKRDKLDKYVRLHQLGDRGKEGTTYLVRTASGEEYAMKTFRKQKSSGTLRKEATLQRIAAEAGAAPTVQDFDTVSKYIVMEKMDRHLVDVLKRNNGVLSVSLQRQIISIYQKLDRVGIFHGDANLMNYMFKGRKLHIIDFGMAREITPNLINKLGTSTPNISIMTLGLVLKLRDLRLSRDSYQYLLEHLTEDQRSQFGLNERKSRQSTSN